MPNHLAGSSSRYLLQHANNPVNWYPWGETAFEAAREADKPIFLSIGYSACHWCHVMAHESFEDEATAALLNRNFISIKVDREERPDLDRIYMNAVQMMTGGGGWPMSVFITPEGVPFYGGTYFPKTPRQGLPSFTQVLLALAEAWQNRRAELLNGAQQVVQALQQQQTFPGTGAGDGLDAGVIEAAYVQLRQRFDSVHGGWGQAPKFPQPMALEFLLRYHHTTKASRALGKVTQTLDAMARGGIYDQLGGGFHRYAVDARWVVPHFEKMLYDNAQLARVYLHGWQVTGQPLFRAIVEETLEYVMREMTVGSPAEGESGGFYATQDADTEGEEGKFFLWTPDEVRAALGGPSTRFLSLYGVTDEGNFEGRTILTFQGTVEEREALAGARRMLSEARDRRIRPGRDEKVLTSWNGLMLAVFAEAAHALGRPDFLKVAEGAADFLLREVRTSEGRLWHVWKDGRASVPGFLEDYAHLTEGLLALYQTSFAPRWYEAACELVDVMLEHFSADVGFYDTGDDAEALMVRPREMQDNAVPSGNAMAATVLLKVARLSGEARYDDVARHSLASMQTLLAKHPLAFGQWLVALDQALAQSTEVAIVGDPRAEEARALLEVARKGYAPHRLLAVGTGEVPPLLAQRPQVDGQATAYVCRASTCRPPVTTPAELEHML